MTGNDTLRTLLGGILILAGILVLAGYAPQLGSAHWTKIAGYLSIAAGVWCVPFLRRR